MNEPIAVVGAGQMGSGIAHVAALSGYDVTMIDVSGAALVVSQFTLYGDVRKGRRPSWTPAEDPERAAAMVEAFAVALEAHGVSVERGVFGADMEVELTNDGPFTLILDADLR